MVAVLVPVPVLGPNVEAGDGMCVDTKNKPTIR